MVSSSIKVEGKHVQAVVDGEDISQVAGLVSFDSESPMGVRCCDELVPVTNLGRTGERLVNNLRLHAAVNRVTIGRTSVKVCATDPAAAAEVAELLATLLRSDLQPNAVVVA